MSDLAIAMKPILAKREATVIAKLVQEHHDGTVTESSLRSGIAEIAALRKLASDLDALGRQTIAADVRDLTRSRPGR